MRSGFCCAYCGSDLSGREPRELALDHLNPKVNGGWHGARNLVLACRSCNCARKEMPWWEFAPAGAVDRIQKLRRRKLNYALARAIIRGDEPHPCPRFS
jgi:5-methylcytosine-specific restriction endonuclease McrA